MASAQSNSLQCQKQLPTPCVTCAVPRNIREALVSWDRTVYDLPMLAGRDGWYEKVYKLGGEDAISATTRWMVSSSFR